MISLFQTMLNSANLEPKHNFPVRPSNMKRLHLFCGFAHRAVAVFSTCNHTQVVLILNVLDTSNVRPTYLTSDLSHVRCLALGSHPDLG